MGEMYQPTSADYANSNANEALQEIRKLKERIDKLEKIVGIFASRVAELENDFDEYVDDELMEKLDFPR